MNIKPWTIYLWQDGENYIGFAIAMVKGLLGFKKGYPYYAAWKIEKDPKFKKNSKKMQIFRAMRSCKTQLNNTLNAIKLYGGDIIDGHGNIDINKFREKEYFGIIAAKAHKKSFNKEKPIKKYQVVNITSDKAKELGII